MSLLANSRFLFLSSVLVIIVQNVGVSSQLDPSTIENLRRASTELLYKFSHKRYVQKTVMNPIHGRSINDYFDDKFAFRTKNRLREPYLRRNMEDQAIEDNRQILDDILFSDLDFSGQSGPSRSKSVFRGENIAICWIETTTIKEDTSTNPPRRFVVREHAISFENSATISKNYMSETDITSYAHQETNEAVNDVIDKDLKTTKWLNSKSSNSFGNLSVTKTKSVRCSSGPVVTKNVLQWDSKPSKKRVIIKIGPQFRVKENMRRFNDSHRKNEEIPKHEPSSRKRFELRAPFKSFPEEEDEDDCSEYGSCEYHSSSVDSEDQYQELCAESNESCWDSQESEDSEYYEEDYSSDESCHSGESCEFSAEYTYDDLKAGELQDNQETEHFTTEDSQSFDDSETTILPTEDYVSSTDESNFAAVTTSVEEESMTTAPPEYISESIETTITSSTDYVSSPGEDASETPSDSREKDLDSVTDSLPEDDYYDGDLTTIAQNLDDSSAPYTESIESTAETSADYTTSSDDDNEAPVMTVLNVDDLHESDTESQTPFDTVTAVSSEDYVTSSDEAFEDRGYSIESVEETEISSPSDTIPEDDSAFTDQPETGSTTESQQTFCANGTCMVLPPECRRTSSGEIECTVIIPNLPMKNYDKKDTTENTIAQEESLSEDGYATTIETTQDQTSQSDSREDTISPSVEVTEEAETINHVSGDEDYEQTIRNSEEKYTTTESITDILEEIDVATDSSMGTEGQEYVDSTVDSFEGKYDTTDLPGSVKDEFTTSGLGADSYKEDATVEQDTSNREPEEDDDQKEDDNINSSTDNYANSESAIGNSKRKNKFTLRVRIKLEKFSRGKGTREKLAVFRKNIELDDFDESDKQNLVQRIKSLNESITAQTIQALFNCSASTLESKDSSKEIENENEPDEEINEETQLDGIMDEDTRRVRSKRSASSVNGSVEELAKSGARKVDQAKLESGRAIEQAIPEIRTDVNDGLDHVATKVLDSLHPVKDVSNKRTEIVLPSIFDSLFNRSESLLSARLKRSISGIPDDKMTMFDNHHGDVRHVLQPVNRWSNKRLKNLNDNDVLETVTEFTIFSRL